MSFLMSSSLAGDETTDDETTDTESDGGNRAPAQSPPKGPNTTHSRVASLLTAARRPMGLLIIALIVVLVAAVAILGVLVTNRSGQLDDIRDAAAMTQKAEDSALSYAVDAANMNYQDIGGWQKRLVQGTSPELTQQLTQAANSMQQVIAPLQWVSTSAPIAAKVKSHNGTTYVVTAFVNVNTKNAQAPDGVQSTATYTVTLDSAKDWQITDVGGVGTNVVPGN